MTDQQMDGRLRAAGERWRAADGADDATVELPPTGGQDNLPQRTPRRPWLLAAAAAAVVALVAGGALALRTTHHNAPSAEFAGLAGHVWLVTGLDGRGAASQSSASFYVDDKGNLVADDECQVSGGTAAVSGNRLTVTHLVTRYKSCVDQYGPGFYQEGLRILRGPATFVIDQQGLTIARAGVGSLQLRLPATNVPPPTLDIPTITDTNWINVSQNGPVGDTLHIVDDGTITSPCSSGHAAISGTSVRISDCPGYDGRWAWSVSGTTLRLTHAHSVTAFAWQPNDPSVIDPAQLTGRTWHLESVAGLPATSSATFRIDGNVATYDDGCRTQSGQVRVQAGTFVIRSHASGSSCNGAGSQAETIDSFLTNSPAVWVVRNGKLIVYGGSGQAFALVYGTGSATSDLSGTWNLTKIVDRNRHQVPVTATAQLVINAKQVSGTDGCRSFRGTVSAHDNAASFSVIMPEPACSSRIEKTAGLVDRLLGGKITYRVGPTSLVLTSAVAGEFTFTKSTTSVGDPAVLLHKTWQLDTITFGDDIYRAGAPTADNGTLRFTEQGYTVNHTCYTVQGNAQRDSGTVQFTGGHTTSEHSCPPLSNRRARAEASQAIDAILGPQTRWTLDGSTLTIESNDGTLVFHEATQLTGTRWQLISVLSGPNRTSALGDLILSFPDDRTLSIKGCNTSEASVEILTGSMSITGLHLTTRLPCPSSTPEDSPAGVLVMGLLNGSVTWSITGDQLTLTKGTDSATFTMTPSASAGLTRSHWTATSIQRGAGPDAPVSTTNTERFGFAGGEFASKFMGAPVTVVGSMITFGGWVDLAVVSNSRMNKSDSTFVKTKLLVGRVKWSISGNTLTLTKPGVGALTLTRS